MEVNNRQTGGPDPARRRPAADSGPAGANRQRNRRAQLNANTEVGQPQATEHKASLNAPGTGGERLASGDVLQLAHGNQSESPSPAREARLRELTKAFQEGSLNSPERLSRAAEKMLLG